MSPKFYAFLLVLFVSSALLTGFGRAHFAPDRVRPVVEMPAASVPASSSEGLTDLLPSALAEAHALPSVNFDGIGIGVVQEPGPWECDGYTKFESQTGARLRYIHWFQHFGHPATLEFKPEWVGCARSHEAVAVITWEPWAPQLGNVQIGDAGRYSLDNIASGNMDWYIRSWARSARDTNWPIYIRFAHEMDTQPGKVVWYPWQGDPKTYVAAWRHIVRVFREEGASNVSWVFSPHTPHESWSKQYYPGDQYVDFTSVTVAGYGVNPEIEPWMNVWYTFRQIFEVRYKALASYGKPVLISELEVAEDEEKNDKGKWFVDMMAEMAAGEYPELVGFIYFNVDKDHKYGVDWSVDSSESSLQGFREGVKLLQTPVSQPAPAPNSKQP